MISKTPLCVLLLVGAHLVLVSGEGKKTRDRVTKANYPVNLEKYLSQHGHSDDLNKTRDALVDYFEGLGSMLGQVDDDVLMVHHQLIHLFKIVEDQNSCANGKEKMKLVKSLDIRDAPILHQLIDTLWKKYIDLCIEEFRSKFTKQASGANRSINTHLKALGELLHNSINPEIFLSGDIIPFEDVDKLTDETMIKAAYDTIIANRVKDDLARKLSPQDARKSLTKQEVSDLLIRYVVNPCSSFVKGTQNSADVLEQMEKEAKDKKYPEGYISYAANFGYCRKFLDMFNRDHLTDILVNYLVKNELKTVKKSAMSCINCT